MRLQPGSKHVSQPWLRSSLNYYAPSLVSPFLLPLFALVAGTISFSSPCCLPLLPGYVSYISALPTSSLGTKEARETTLRASLAFVAGFTLVFTTLGVASAFFGSFVLRTLPTIVRVWEWGSLSSACPWQGCCASPPFSENVASTWRAVPRVPGAPLASAWRSRPGGRRASAPSWP